MESKRPLSDWTKTLLGLGLKEWRLELLYEDRSNSSCQHKRVVAYNENEAALILLKDWSFEEVLEKNWENALISELEKYTDEIITQSEKYWGFPAIKELSPGIYDIDPFDGELTLIEDYPAGFIPYFEDHGDDEDEEDEDSDDEDE